MSQLEGFKISDVSPVSESIIDQTDNILDDEKEIATNYSNITFDSIKSDDSKTKDFEETKEKFIKESQEEKLFEQRAVDTPKVKKEIKEIKETKESTYSNITLDSLDDIDISNIKEEDTELEDLIYVNQALNLKEEDENSFFRLHPAGSVAMDMPEVFQQEFFSSLLENYSEDEIAIMSKQLAMASGELTDAIQPLQFIGELSVAQGARNVIQELMRFGSFISPFSGGDKWWNGFGKNRYDIAEAWDAAEELPNLNTSGGVLDKTVQLTTEFFIPAGYAVKGTKLYSQLLTGVDDIAKWKKKFSRGEDIGAFAVGFGLVDMTLVNPTDANLAKILKEKTELEGPMGWLLDALSTDPNNTEAYNRFARTVEGMGIGFTFEGALWLAKITGTGVAKGTISVVKPLDQDLYEYMKQVVPQDLSIAQRMWGELQRFNGKKIIDDFVFKTSDEQVAIRLLEGEVEGALPSIMNLRSKELLDEFQRLKKLPENKNLSPYEIRLKAENNIGYSGSGGKSAWVEFKLLKSVGRVIDNFYNHGTASWRDAKDGILDYSRLNKNGESFVEVMSKSIKTKTQLNDFKFYLVAERALNLYKRGYKPTEIIDKFDLKKFQQVVKNGRNSKVFQSTLKDLQAYNSRLMDFAVDSGLINRQSADAMLKANPIYVPFFRITENITTDGILTSAKTGTRKAPFKGFEGGGGMILDPYQSLLKNTAVIVEAAMRNRANQTLSTYLDKVVVKRKAEALKIANQLGYKGKIKRDFINDYSLAWAEPITKRDALGFIKVSKKDLEAQLKKQNVNVDIVDDAGVDEFINIMHFNQKNIRTPNGELVFVANFPDGPKFYKVRDDKLKHALDTFGWRSFEYQGLIMKGLAKQKGMVSWLITRDPSFALWANPTRDSVGGAINSNTWNKIPFIDTSIGAWKVLKYTIGASKNSDDYQKVFDYMNNGGGFGTLYYGNSEVYEQQLKKYFNKELNIPTSQIITNSKQFATFYSDMISSMEHATRFREYEKNIALGYSEREAAVMAREVSVDFSNKGAAQWITGFNQSVPFLNPAIQGSAKAIRTWFKEGRFGQVFVKTNMYVGAPTATLWMLNHNNPDYQAYPDWAKRQAWFIPVGTYFDERVGREKTKFILVPKPFDLFGMYSNAMEATLQASYEASLNITNGDSVKADVIMGEWVKSMYHNMGHALPPVPLPPSLVAGFAVFGNVDSFTGGNIIPQRLESAPPEFQYTPWTSETIIALSKKLNVSPLKVQAVYDAVLPGLGKDFLNLADVVTNHLTDDKFNTDLPFSLENFPILDRMYEDGIPTITQQEIDMFEQVSDGLSDYISETLLVELLVSDEEAVTKWLENEDNREKIMQRPVLLQYLQESAKINSEIRRISMDKTYSAKNRQKDIYQLQQMKQDMAKEYLEMLEDMKDYLTK
jgi:hypothetical protein